MDKTRPDKKIRTKKTCRTKNEDRKKPKNENGKLENSKDKNNTHRSQNSLRGQCINNAAAAPAMLLTRFFTSVGQTKMFKKQSEKIYSV